MRLGPAQRRAAAKLLRGSGGGGGGGGGAPDGGWERVLAPLLLPLVCVGRGPLSYSTYCRPLSDACSSPTYASEPRRTRGAAASASHSDTIKEPSRPEA